MMEVRGSNVELELDSPTRVQDILWGVRVVTETSYFVYYL